MNKSIMYLNYHTKFGAEKNDLYFFNYLKEYLNIDLFLLSDNQEAGYYSYKKNFKFDKEFCKTKIFWLHNKSEIFLSILKYDVIIISGLYGASEFSKFCKKLNKRVIILDSYFNQDFPRNIEADLILFKSQYSLKTLKKLSNIEHIENKICGCIQSIFIKKNFLTKENFYKKYKLKKNKNIILFPHGPQYLKDSFYINTFKKILNVLSSKNYNVLINLHPTFFLKKKSKKFSLEKLYKSAKNKKNSIVIVSPSDIYNAIRYSKLAVSIASNVFQQVNLINKPMIFVERQKFYSSDKKFIDNKKITNKLDLYKYSINKNLKNQNENNIISAQLLKNHMFFYGADINLQKIDKIFSLKNKCNLRSKKFKKHLENISRFQGMDCYKKTSTAIYNFIHKIHINKKNYFQIMYYKKKIEFWLMLKNLNKKINF